MNRLTRKLDKSRNDGHPLFIVSGLGGHIFPFQLIAKQISTQWNAYGLLYPGFVKDEAKCQTMEALAQRMIQDIRKVQTTGPYFLAGYSMGGFVCIEIAKILNILGEKASIIIIDVILIEHAPLKPFIARLPILIKWKSIGWYKTKILKEKVFPQIPDDQKQNDLEKSDLPVSESLKNVTEDGRRALRSYKLSKTDISAALLKSQDGYWYDTLRIWPRDYGWNNYCDVKSVAKTPGNHINLIKSPNIQSFVINIEKLLDGLKKD